MDSLSPLPDRVETSALISEFGTASYKFTRRDLGAWVGIKDEVNSVGPVIISVPEDNADKNEWGCSIFFQRVTDNDEAIIARALTEKYNLQSPQWMTPEGQFIVLG